MRPTAPRSVLLALLAVTALECAAADELGTLFTTPEERARLDRLRRGEPSTAAAPTPRSTHRPAVTGYVQRSDGRNTVWIDGRPVVIASPGSRMLEPGIVQPQGSDRILRVEPPDKEER